MTIDAPGGRGPWIENDLQAALSVDPSPEFVARVRTRIANEPAPRRWTAWWIIPAAAIAVAALAIGVFVSRSAPMSLETPMLASRGLGSIEVPDVARRLEPALPPVEVVIQAPRPERTEDLVLIDQAESRTLRRLVFGKPLNIDKPYTGPSDAEIEIAPIAIESLSIGPEGDNR
jgi:hypothetical protein